MRLKKRVIFGTLLFAALFTISCGGKEEVVTEVTETKTVVSNVITVVDNKGYVGDYPNQFELAEFEELTGETLTFSDNPLFADMDVSVEERLPADPLVIAPDFEAGTYGGTLRLHSRAPESGTMGALSMRHANLVRMAADSKTVIPDVAKSFEYNDDFTELTFKLREGHKWSDGYPFTTEDILFWWEDIQLYEELNSILKSKWRFGGEPMEVTAIDDTTVKFSFAVPSPGFVLRLAVEYTQPFQPKHVLKEFHKKYNPDVDALAESLGYKSWEILFYVYFNDWKDTYHPISGKKPTDIPTLESHTIYEETTEHRKFEANPYYHIVDTAGNQLPYMDEIYEVFVEDTQVRNLKISQGEIDFKAQDMELVDYLYFQKNIEDGDYAVRLVPATTAQMPAPGFNVNHKDPILREIFNNVKFKQAMSLAINRDEINDIIFLGTGIPMAGVPGSLARTEFLTEEMVTHMIEYDVERANELLDEIGLTKGSNGFRVREDGKPFIVYLTYTTQGSAAKVWQLLKEYWDAVGVQTELKEVNTDLYRNVVENNDHDLSAWTAGGGEPPQYYSGSSPFIPPFGGGAAVSWEKWLTSDGLEGEKPPQDILDLIEMNNEFIQQGYRSERFNELGKQMSEIIVKKMFLIGTVGETKVPVIVHNRIGNVGEMQITSSSYNFNYPFRPCQWYLKY